MRERDDPMEFTDSFERKIFGCYRDVLRDSAGQIRDSGWKRNTVVAACHQLIASFMAGPASLGIQGHRLKSPTLDATKADSYELYTLPIGYQHLDPYMALWYVRSRGRPRPAARRCADPWSATAPARPALLSFGPHPARA